MPSSTAGTAVEPYSVYFWASLRRVQDFESDGAYDDYLEEVEDLIFRWVNVNADEASEQLERQTRARPSTVH